MTKLLFCVRANDLIWSRIGFLIKKQEEKEGVTDDHTIRMALIACNQLEMQCFVSKEKQDLINTGCCSEGLSDQMELNKTQKQTNLSNIFGNGFKRFDHRNPVLRHFGFRF